MISEIMCHPAGNPGEEFIELQNINDAVTLELSDVRFTAGIGFDFTGSAVTSLTPGARVLIVRNQAAFENVHGTGLPIAGEFANLSVLDNDGEMLKLEDASNSTIKEFRYNDAFPWPVEPDGLDDLLGYALGHTPGENDGLPTLSLTNGIVTLAYTQNLVADDITLTPEWSTDLLNWHPLGDSFDLFSFASIGARKTVVYLSNPEVFQAGERLFIRLTAQL